MSHFVTNCTECGREISLGIKDMLCVKCRTDMKRDLAGAEMHERWRAEWPCTTTVKG